MSFKRKLNLKNRDRLIFISIVDTRDTSKRIQNIDIQDEDGWHHVDDLDETRQDHHHDCLSQASLAPVLCLLGRVGGAT